MSVVNTLTVLLNSGMLYSAAFCTNYDVTNSRFAATSAAGYVIFYELATGATDTFYGCGIEKPLL